MRDYARCAAAQAAGSEQTCIVIGVDADGTVRVSQFRDWGRLSAAYTGRPAGWLSASIDKIVSEAVNDALATAGASPCKGC